MLCRKLSEPKACQASAAYADQTGAGETMKGLKRLSFLTTALMFIVVIGGALVTKTGSGEECGNTWPLCHGRFIPAYTIGSLIEYSHRFFSGLTGILVVILTIWVFARLKRKDARLFAGSAFFFTFLQAALGAGAVVWSQSDLVMALHFGISLIAFASALMLSITMARLHLPASPDGWGERLEFAGAALHFGFRWLVWSTLLYTYVVVYLGAYVRHADAINGCLGWPLCNGAVIPELTGASGINFLHRFASLLLLLMAIWLYAAARRFGADSIVHKCAGWTMWLTVAQILTGALIVFTLRDENWLVFTGLLHSIVICAQFGVLCYLSFLAWRMGKGGSSGEQAVPAAAR